MGRGRGVSLGLGVGWEMKQKKSKRILRSCYFIVVWRSIICVEAKFSATGRRVSLYIYIYLSIIYIGREMKDWVYFFVLFLF